MVLFDNLLTIFILLSLFLLIYLRIKDITLLDFFRELKEIFSESKEEVLQYE